MSNTNTQTNDICGCGKCTDPAQMWHCEQNANKDDAIILQSHLIIDEIMLKINILETENKNLKRELQQREATIKQKDWEINQLELEIQDVFKAKVFYWETKERYRKFVAKWVIKKTKKAKRKKWFLKRFF